MLPLGTSLYVLHALLRLEKKMGQMDGHQTDALCLTLDTASAIDSNFLFKQEFLLFLPFTPQMPLVGQVTKKPRLTA